MQSQQVLTFSLPAVESTTPMMAQYWEVKNRHQDCLLFFRMGDFFELFFDDAIVAAKALDIALTKRGKHSDQDVPMCGVPAHAYEAYLHKLIAKGYKVAICEQLESPESAKKRGAKGPLRRDVIRIVTAGTLTEESLLPARSHNFLVGLSPIKDNMLAIAYLDLSTGMFRVEQSNPQVVASVLARLQPSEILLPESYAGFGEALAPFKKALCYLPAARFDRQNCEQTLNAVYNVKTIDSFGGFNPLEVMALGTVVDYVRLCHKTSLHLLSPPKQQNPTHFMMIDASTQRNLELVQTLSGAYQGSILSVIDATKTAAGGRLLASRLVAPLTDPAAINQRLDRIDFFIKEEKLRQQCLALLSQCPDMERALSRINLGRGSPRDLGLMRDGLHKAQQLKELLPSHAELGSFDPLINRLQRALQESLPPHMRDGEFIAPAYDAQLDEFRSLRADSQGSLMRLQAQYISETGIQTLKIKHNNILGYHIEIGASQSHKIPASFVHRQTMASHMRYTTQELSEWARKVEGAAYQALARELELFAELVESVQARAKEILTCCQAIARLDIAASLADLAIARNYKRPLIDNSSTFEIKGGRHPVIEEALRSQHNEPFVHNDCLLDEYQRIILLTGPNMAGKSTYLRQNALLAILAQAGLFIPAESAHIGVVDRIFSRIGAADDLASGRSTFMVEMVETATILNQATDRSLVILDEIGRGTSTYDGMSIAWAVIEAIAQNNKSRTLFATHYHELTRLAQDLPMLKNFTMRIHEWEGKVVFMHNVVPGSADKSYGLHVAALAGVPRPTIERAEKILATLEKPKIPLQVPLQEKSEEPLVFETLRALDIDTLSPRQALDQLYQLKEMAVEKR